MYFFLQLLKNNLGNVLKRYFLFNILFSTILITFLFFNLKLIHFILIISHLCLVFYYLFSIFIILTIINSFYEAKFLSILTLIIYQIFICTVYLSYYLGKEMVGSPFTLEIIYPYLLNFKLFLNYLSSFKIISFLLLFIFFVLLQIKIFKNVFIEFKALEKIFLQTNKKIKIFGVLIIIFSPFFILTLDEELNAIRGFKNHEPSLSFFFATLNFEQRKVGLENIQIMDEYSNDFNFEKRNVILIICDAFRADYIGAYGNKNNVTPFLDSLVNSDNYFKVDNYFSTSSWSYSGILNILSSSYKIFNNNFFIHDLLKKEGYNVNLLLSGDFTNFYGLENLINTKSVDKYYDGYIANQENDRINFNDDKRIVLDKLNDMRQFSGEPTFFYLHFMSTHQLGTLNSSFKRFKPGNIDITNQRPNKLRMRNNYSNRVLQLDNYLKETFKILKDKNYLKKSIVIITADHGQSLGEKEKYFHGKSTYINEIKIPLIISNNNSKSLNEQIIANQLDIGPTIVDLLNVPKPMNWKGESVFKKKKSKPIFQHQRYYYSIIWEEGNVTYQYVYNKKKLKEEVFILNTTASSEKNIINNYPEIKLDSLKKILFKFYDLKKI